MIRSLTPENPYILLRIVGERQVENVVNSEYIEQEVDRPITLEYYVENIRALHMLL